MCKITEELKKPLDTKAISQREKGGVKLDYIEAWHAINEANRIFGFLSWELDTVYCKEVSREKNNNGNHVVGYEAKVTITLHTDKGSIVRSGTGYGSGIAKGLFDAIEGAGKEAETDAMKRAFRTFGNPFGLALYDKSRANVADTDHEEEERAAKEANARTWLAAFADKLTKAESMDGVVKLIEDTRERRNRIAEGYPHLVAGMDASIAKAEARFKQPETILAAG